VDLEDLTKAMRVPPWLRVTTTTRVMEDLRHPAGTLIPRPPVTTFTTEDIPSIPKDPDPTLVPDLRQGRLLLLPVHQEHRLHLYLNLTTSTRRAVTDQLPTQGDQGDHQDLLDLVQWVPLAPQVPPCSPQDPDL
jgi:hypothetical protein